jgi:hypothetical protein
MALNVKLGDARPKDELQDIGLHSSPQPHPRPHQNSISQLALLRSAGRVQGDLKVNPRRPVQARVRQARVGRRAVSNVRTLHYLYCSRQLLISTSGTLGLMETSLPQLLLP